MMITNIIGGLVAAAVALTSAAHVVDKPSGNNYAVSVGTDEKRLDLSALPCDPPIHDGEYMMVPLRAVAEGARLQGQLQRGNRRNNGRRRLHSGGNAEERLGKSDLLGTSSGDRYVARG